MPTSVLLADFQFLTREGIASLIKSIPDFEIIGQVNNASDLETTIYNLQPELTVLDISDKDRALITTLERIKEKTSGKFLIISNSQSRESIQRLLGMGIKGIVTKNCSEEEISNALMAVRQNHRFFCNNILDLVVEDQTARDNCDPTSLSPREYEVLTFIAKGLTTTQIAETLFLSVHTINSHRKNILRKLNMKSPTELVAYAIKSGLVKVS